MQRVLLMVQVVWCCAGAKFTWKATWEAFMRELAPQDTKGAYQRPKYGFADEISDKPGTKFPVRASISAPSDARDTEHN